MRMPIQSRPVDRKARMSGVGENGLTQSDCCGSGKCCVGACLFGHCAGACVPNFGQC